MKKSAQNNVLKQKGFTLVELLVVIAIIGILAAVVVLLINPIEFTRRGRDASRLSDLANLQTAINVAVQDATGSSTAAILCVSGLTSGHCQGSSSPTTNANRAPDGTGWAKVNLSAVSSVSVPTLPVDPSNAAPHVYQYYSDGNGWKITAVLESTQQAGKMQTDGGNNDNEYEIGSNLSLPI